MHDSTEILQFFDQVLSLDPGQREDFISKACDGNQDLQGRLRALLAAYAKAADFLEKPASFAIDSDLTSDHWEGNSTANFAVQDKHIISPPNAKRPWATITAYKPVQPLANTSC